MKVLPRVLGMLRRIQTGCLVLLASPLSWSGDQVLYLTDGGGLRLHVLDPDTSAVLDILSIKGQAYLGGINSLTFDGARLFTYNLSQPWIPDRLVGLHPADAYATVLGLTGHNVSVTCIAADPRTGELYGLLTDNFYRFDKATGQATFLSTANDYVHSMAIDSSGVVFGVTSNFPPRLCIIDLPSGNCTPLGILTPSPGVFWDLAFDQDDELWGSCYGALPSQHGIYTIDINTQSVVLKLATPYVMRGLAFGPVLDIATYCTSKTGGLGCAPRISGFGVPSPTASSGFRIRCDEVVNGTIGQLIYSLSAGSLPFQGGTICMHPQLQRSFLQSSGGTPGPPADCSGSWQVDFNRTMVWNGALPPGFTVYAQWWGRDPTSIPFPSSLSDALSFTLQP